MYVEAIYGGGGVGSRDGVLYKRVLGPERTLTYLICS